MLSRVASLLLIREGEQKQVIYFFTLFAILGCGMAFGRNSANVLFFKRYGIEFLPVMYMVLSVILALVSTFYAAFADRISPERLSVILSSLLIVFLMGNWAWMSFSDMGLAYPAYFLFYEIASEILVIHLVHYASQNFDSLQAKRLFPMIMAGTQIGIIAGSLVLASISSYINIQNILLGWCLLTTVPLYMIYAWHKKRGCSTYFRSMPKSANQLKQAVSQVSFGVTLIKTSPLLKAASFALFFMVISFYILTYSVNRIYTETFQTEAELTGFFGILSATTNGLALFLQIFITNRVIHRFGVKNVNLIFPITSLLSYLSLLVSFALIPAIAGSINRDSIMPAFRNPLRTIFFNALPENVRGRASASSVVIVLPLALLTCGGALIVMQKMGEPAWFLATGFIATAFYMFFNIKMNRSYVAEILTTLRNKILITESTGAEKITVAAKQIAANRKPFRSEAVLKLFKMLVDSRPEIAEELLLLEPEQHESAFTDKMVTLLAPASPPGFADVIWDIYNETNDIHLQSTILIVLFKMQHPQVAGLLPGLLSDSPPRLQATAIVGCLYTDKSREASEMKNNAIQYWIALASVSDTDRQMASLGLIEYLNMIPAAQPKVLPAYKEMLASILSTGNQRRINTALNALLYWPEATYPELAEKLDTIFQHGNTATRQLCVKCTRLCYEQSQSLLKKAVDDTNRLVRNEAARVHYDMAGDDARDTLVLWLTAEANGSPRAQRAFLGVLHEVGVDSEQLRDIARSRAELARSFYLGHQILAQHKEYQSAPYQLVRHILQERTREYVELSLYAMKGLENPDDTYIVWASLNSNDPRYIANACEVLRDLNNKELGELLSDLVAQQPLKFSKQKNICFKDNVTSVLSWCKSLPDPWLSMCAKQAMESLG